MAMGAVVELENVTKTIKGRKIIDNLSFSVNAGRCSVFRAERRR